MTSASATQVAEAEKEGAVQQALAQGWQREAALLAPQLHHIQAQLAMHEKQVCAACYCNLPACQLAPEQRWQP